MQEAYPERGARSTTVCTGGRAVAGRLSTGQSVVAALVIAVVLAGLHLAAPRIRRLPFVPEAVTGSFAGGLAVAYVFLHLLPELAEGNESVGEALRRVLRPTPLVDLGIFLVALAGFTAFYGLERLADRRQAERREPVVVPAGAGAPAAPRARSPRRGSTGCTWRRSWSTTR
jgi:hypothetical protein